MAVTAIHPGEHLAEELKALDMSAAELARQMDVPTNCITQILNGTRAITGDTALRLAHFFGTSAEVWLNLQSLYELRIAREKAGNLSKHFPH
jgi:antitoxin HigA-1